MSLPDGRKRDCRVVKIVGIPQNYEVAMGDCVRPFIPLGHRLLPVYVINHCTREPFTGAVVASPSLASDPVVYQTQEQT